MKEDDLAPFSDQYHFKVCDPFSEKDPEGLPDVPGVYILGETTCSSARRPSSELNSGFRYPYDEYSPIFFIGSSWVRSGDRIWTLTLREHWLLKSKLIYVAGVDSEQFTYPDEIMYASGLSAFACAWHEPQIDRSRTPFDYQADLLDIFRDKYCAKPVANHWPANYQTNWDKLLEGELEDGDFPSKPA